MALAGRRPETQFTEAASLVVDCADQSEVDRLWDALTAAGGAESMCGWCRDRFGVSWQIVPSEMGDMFAAPDKEAAGRAMQAMLQMKKIDIAELRRAFEG